MKRLSLLLVMIFILGMVVSALNASEVTIGAGDQQARKPVDMYWKNSLFQGLYFQNELMIVSGSITGVSFYNNFVTDLPNMPTKIWLGTTTQTSLATYIPSTQLTQVFDGTVNYPMGQNTITINFTTPFQYSGGTLVMMVNRPMDTDYYDSTDNFYCQTIGTNRALSNQSDSETYDPAAPPATPTISGQFPKTTFYYTGQGIANDMACLSVTGNSTPSAGSASPYIVTVKNNGTNTQATYTVKLMKEGNVEIASQPGVSLTQNQTHDFTFNWTPATAGPTYIYGEVVLTGDAIADNNQSPQFNVVVQPAGVNSVTIGAGNETDRMPVDMFWKNSLFQAIYLSSELNIATGSITGLSFYNNFVTNLPDKPTKIWLGETTQTELTAYIPSTQLTLVFDGTVSYPSGENIINIPLTTPYNYFGGNLVMMVNRPMDTGYFSSSDNFYCQTVGTNRSLKNQSDSDTYDPANPPATPTASGRFPKTTFFYSSTMVTTDIAAMSISGNVTPSAGTASNYTITIKNNGTAPQSTYTVKLMNAANVELGSVAGPTIQPSEILQVIVPWTPAAAGPATIYGKVILAGDQVESNNQTPNLNVVVQTAGVTAITIGNGGSTGRMPVNMFYMNSLFETIYPASEMNIGGSITGIQFYNSFATDLPNMPTNIWMGETAVENLADGWIPSTQLTQVFNGTVNYPSGQNAINIPFPTPFMYGGGNLVVMVERPMDVDYYSSSDVFVTQTVGTNRTLNVYSDGTDFDPAAPPTGTTPTGAFPKTTFFLIVDDMGSLNGTVTVDGAPLPGATVTVGGTALSYTTMADGTYNFPYVFEGNYTVSATKHGYTEVSHPVTIVEDQATTQNFALALLPQVAVSGRVVGSDAPTVGLAGATVNFTGYEPYTTTTDAMGMFNIPNVYANHTYDYTITATGYAALTGQVVVGGTPVAMGDLIVNEIAYPASGVVATEAVDFSNVVINWNAPVAGTQGWLNYDSGENNDSIGTGGAADFDVAIRYPASALIDYAGTSLQAVKVWPAQAGTFSIRVWTGGTPEAPATMVVDQPFTPVLDQWNTVLLNTPVPITGAEELWFGYRCNVTSGYPAGCDAGPALDGFGNMMYWQGAWTTLLTLAPTLNYNWNIQGYAGFGAPDRGQKLIPITAEPRRMSEGTFAASGIRSLNSRPVQTVETRVHTGYHLYRLLAANQGNEATWTQLSPANGYGQTSFADNAWAPLPSGVYKYAVKAIYTNNVLSAPAFSNEIHKGMMGTLAGTVTEFGTNLPIEGATVTAGTYSGTTNASGAYSFAVYAGNYTVTAAKTGYQSASQPGVVIVGLQTTTQNFVLTEITLPPAGVVAELAGNNVNVTWLAPGAGAELTEGFEGATFPPEDWTQVITDTGAGSSGVLPTWCRIGTVALTPEVPPHGGAFQSGLWWSYDHQDEWLKTPAFNCLPNATLTFWSYVYLGSTNGDHYYVKVSTNGGTDWTTLWDASTLTGGWNYYATPVTIDLAAYSGQEIMLAWHAEDPPTNDGLWYVWFIDDIHVGTPTQTMRLNGGSIARYNPNQMPKIHSVDRPASRAAVSNPGIQEDVLTSDRALTGYRVWRLLQGQETNEGAWTSLTANPITATAYQDAGWGPLPDGTYKWAVKAIYTGGAMSNASFSNPLQKATQIGTIAGFVRNTQNQGISGATVTNGTVTATTNTTGAYSMTVASGTHSVTASHPSYSAVTQNGVVVVTGQTTQLNFQLPASQILLQDGFESYADFSLTFAPWTLVDVDQSATYGFTGITFPNSGSPMAYIVFNPAATTPAVTGAEPHGGAKYAASFAATTPPNNDWLITPQVNGGGIFKFWARSYVSTYGLERFKVGVSTTGTAPENFTIISGANYVQAPVEWTEYTYDLSSYGRVPIRLGIQCLSDDAFIFFVDDVTVMGGPDSNPNDVVPVIETALQGNYPNPFNPETNIRFSLKEATPVAIEIYNVKGQLVKTLFNGVKDSGNHALVWNGTDNHGRAVSSGVYYYKMNAGKYSSTKKMIMMK